MSSSTAPSAIACRASSAFTDEAIAPSGNPTTAQVFTVDPSSAFRTRSTQRPLMHTAAVPSSRATCAA